MKDNDTCNRSDNKGHPRIGIYTGRGTSHSWLWFVEIFDRIGFFDLAFLSETHLKGGGLDRCDVLAMSGGDTFAIAEGLGPEGAERLERFITNGGLYIGSCAGAYLPLHSSKEHLNLFNFVPAKVANLTRILPEARRLREKFCTAYGCAYIFHPVREAVRLATNGFIPFKKVPALDAPLYGGPPMVAGDPVQVLATYSGFTEKTVFLVDEKLAADTVLGKAAVIRQKMGRGFFHLYGPHFEHPRFPTANQLLTDAMLWDLPHDPDRIPDRGVYGETLSGKACRLLLKDIKREISNARIVAVGLETLPVQWVIGNKVYETAKIREFIEPVWQRIKPLERLNQMRLLPGQAGRLIASASETTALLREMKRSLKQGTDTIFPARTLFERLNRTSTLFLEIYFRTKLMGNSGIEDKGLRD
ncbi:MAG: hypothetical protein K9N21_11340 [Deltaproteobacteria bacterium]|nr:hypothetical protein [Deltaproteobacteria bacterium]